MHKEEIKQFMNKVHKLDTGARATLRRHAGVVLEEANGNALAVFFNCLPLSVPEWMRGRFFAAACFDCLWLSPEDTAQPMPVLLRQMLDSEGSVSLSKRITALLDTKWYDGEGYLLTKLVRLLKMLRQKRYRIDCTELLEDLIGWDSEKQYVQIRWADRIFGEKRKEEKSEEVL